MGEVLILKKILDPQIHRGLSSINKTKKYKYLTPFHNLEGMTAKISVLFPEQNVDLTDLYTKFICFSISGISFPYFNIQKSIHTKFKMLAQKSVWST